MRLNNGYSQPRTGHDRNARVPAKIVPTWNLDNSIYNRWSGKEVALLPPPPLRTGRESFPSSGSSQSKAPPERSRSHDGLIPACWRVRPNFFWNARFSK
jgi:hypothetical protein